jgi:hypothetical protein
MNTLKNVLFFGLLLAVLCGVYLSLNRPPDSPLPKDLNPTPTPRKVEMGSLVGANLSNTSTSPEPSTPPGFPSQPPAMTPPQTGGHADGTPPWFSGTTSSGGALSAPPGTPSITGTSVLPPADLSATGAASSAAQRPANYPAGVERPPEHDPRGMLSSDRARANGSPPPPEHSAANSLNLVMQRVKLKLAEKRFADALSILSTIYDSPDLPPANAREITEILDWMAAKVIYSREHLLENPYRVQSNENLDAIADRCGVPALLLARINGIRDPQNLPPGKELKVLKGPFYAIISTDRSELTMYINGLYAGRFSVSLSSDLSHASNWWTVRKPPAASASFGANKPSLDLVGKTGNVSMQGTNDTRVSASRESRNTIWLSEQDMDDVFGILSVGSRVIIQR